MAGPEPKLAPPPRETAPGGFRRRARSASLPAMSARPLLALLLVATCALAGCSKREELPAGGEPMTLEELDRLNDTTGLSKGPERFRRLEAARGPDGQVRANGAIAFPDGTVGQLVVYADGATTPLTRIPFRLADGRFRDVLVSGPGGPLAPGRYRFEVTVLLAPSIQSADVMRSLGDPSRLRGPGITRDRLGGAAYTHREEFPL